MGDCFREFAKHRIVSGFLLYFVYGHSLWDKVMAQIIHVHFSGVLGWWSVNIVRVAAEIFGFLASLPGLYRISQS